MPEHDDSQPTGSSALRVTWIGHSTVLLELDGVRLLTDPILRARAAHLRRVGPPVDLATVGRLDAVLISHLHYDHLDLPSLRRLGRDVRVVMPEGAGSYLRLRGFTNTIEAAVGQELRLGGVTIRPTPAEHPGRRTPLGTDARAVGYAVDGSARAYFAGDTDLFEGMSELATDLDLALLPVAGWGARLPPGHLNARRAAEALRLLRPRVAVPIHWGTYRSVGLTRDAAALRAPAEEFVREARELAPEVDVRLLPVGGSCELSAVAP